MGLYESVRKTAEKHSDNQILLILHTSCVLESEHALKLLSQIKNVSIAVPNGVYYELQLLKNSSNQKFANNSSLILTELCHERMLRYDLEQFYKNCVSFTDVCDFSYGITVFGFYDHSVAEEFIKNFFTRKKDKVYIYSFDPYGFNKDFDNIRPISDYNRLSLISEPFLCKCIPVICKQSVENNSIENSQLCIISGEPRNYKQKFIRGSNLNLIAGGIGGEAKVYSSPEVPGSAIKCYTKVYPSKEKKEKLQDLIKLGYKISSPYISMPTGLVYDEKKRCIGFVMPEVKGRSLSSIYYNELWNRYNRKDILKKLALLLLELRLYRINVVDLSGNNVRIGENGQVYIIDCDSFETYRFPGSGFTPPYGSPDLDINKLDTRLREPHQNNFEFAVLLFQCLLGWENPLTQKNMGDENPDWNVYQFPYEYNSHTNAAKSKFERWMTLDEDVRRAFADEFHFRRRHNIGSWIKVLKIK